MSSSPTVCAHAISPDQKWWQTVLEIKNYMQPMRRFSMHSQRVQFFSFWGGVGVGVGDFFFPLFPMCSHHVSIRFLSGSQRVRQDVPNSTSIYSYMVLPKVQFSYIYKLENKMKGRRFVFISQLEFQKVQWVQENQGVNVFALHTYTYHLWPIYKYLLIFLSTTYLRQHQNKSTYCNELFQLLVKHDDYIMT